MYLDRIVETKRREVAQRDTFSISEAERQIADLPPTLGFEKALSMGRNRDGVNCRGEEGFAVQGLIRPDFDPVMIAKAYEAPTPIVFPC